MDLDTPHFLLKIAPFQQGAKIPHTVYHKTAPKTTVPLYKGRNFLKSPSSEPSFQQIVEKPWWKTAGAVLKIKITRRRERQDRRVTMWAKTGCTLHLVDQQKIRNNLAFLRKNIPKSIDKTYIHRV